MTALPVRDLLRAGSVDRGRDPSSVELRRPKWRVRSLCVVRTAAMSTGRTVRVQASLRRDLAPSSLGRERIALPFAAYLFFCRGVMAIKDPDEVREIFDHF